jgi:hypothetical protein
MSQKQPTLIRLKQKGLKLSGFKPLLNETDCDYGSACAGVCEESVQLTCGVEPMLNVL